MADVTYDDGDKPEDPAPTLGLRQKATSNWTNDRTHQWAHGPDGHKASPFLLDNHVCNCSSTDCQRSGPKHAFEKPPGNKHVQVAADGASDGENDEANITCMVDRQSPILL